MTMNHVKFMQVAVDQAQEALTRGEFPVGCVIVCEDRIIAKGARSASFGNNQNEIDHAEINALRQVTASGNQYPIDRLTLYSTLEPCLMCFGAIVISGITRVVYAYEDVMGGGTSIDLKSLTPLYGKKKITIIPNVMRPESLKLFKLFFEDPSHEYWKDSLLARHTFSQWDILES